MKREDGRKNDEMRPTEMKVGILRQADGSAMVKMGETVALASVYGPREMHPRRLQDPTQTVLRCIYNMAPFSTGERCRPGPSRRSKEISMVTREALEPALYLEDFPKTVIDLNITIISANAGTRTAGINAASLALADAGIKMRDLVTSIAAGKIGKNHVLDLQGKEEDETDCDLPVAYMKREKKITLLQMDGDMSPKDIKGVIKMAIKGCDKLYEMQRKALLEKWDKKEGLK